MKLLRPASQQGYGGVINSCTLVVLCQLVHRVSCIPVAFHGFAMLLLPLVVSLLWVDPKAKWWLTIQTTLSMAGCILSRVGDKTPSCLGTGQLEDKEIEYYIVVNINKLNKILDV